MQHIAACMGPLSAHCSLPELQALLAAFPLAKPAEEATRRLGQALALGSIAAHAPARYADADSVLIRCLVTCAHLQPVPRN